MALRVGTIESGSYVALRIKARMEARLVAARAWFCRLGPNQQHRAGGVASHFGADGAQKPFE